MPLDFVAPFCASCVLVSAIDGPINVVDLPIHLPFGIGFLLQRREDLLPDACALPAIKAAGDGAPRSISLWEISPRRSCSHDPQDRVEDQAMILCWVSHFWVLRWQERTQSLPLLVCQFSSSHTFHYRQEMRFCKHDLVCERKHTMSASVRSSFPGGKATKHPASSLTPQEQAVLQQAKCRHGEHVTITALTPGERLCTFCSFGTFCPVCTPTYLMTHRHRTRAYPYECYQHRDRKGGYV